ncbi:response regulator [Methylobacter sp. G7]|uniref:response regulator n=1 Tax=Methylobacter sp. G7 TaxID=3230117 RepID=UPI003D8019E1
MSEQPWVSTKEAALLLGVSQRTVQNWVDRGKIKASLTMGGHRRLSREDVKKHLSTVHPLLTGNDETFVLPAINSDTTLRVLIVEDDYAILRLCELQFSHFSVPHQLFLATNAYQGLIMVGKYQPHLIFTDLKMPHIDGLHMISEIIKMPEMKHTKIVIVTGLETREIMKMGTMPDGVMVLPKPIPFNTVETILYQQANAIKAATDNASTPYDAAD